MGGGIGDVGPGATNGFGVLAVCGGGLIEEADFGDFVLEGGEVHRGFFLLFFRCSGGSSLVVDISCGGRRRRRRGCIFLLLLLLLLLQPPPSLFFQGILRTGHQDEVAERFGRGFGADIALGAADDVEDGGGLFIDEGLFLLAHGWWMSLCRSIYFLFLFWCSLFSLPKPDGMVSFFI